MTIQGEIAQKIMKKVVNAIKYTDPEKNLTKEQRELIEKFRERIYKNLYQVK